MINKNFKQNCFITSLAQCDYQVTGIEHIYIAKDLSGVEYVIENNIIIDMFNITWSEIFPSSVKINQLKKQSSEEQVTLSFQITDLNIYNEFSINPMLKGSYIFLFVTNSGNVFYLDTMQLASMTQTTNPNGYVLNYVGSQDKVLWEVNYNYYLYGFTTIPDVTPIIPCSFYYSDEALLSVQPDALDIDCLVEDYDGWV